MTDAWVRVAVATCCLLAGCGASPIGDPGTDQTGTLTPVPVPTAPPTASPGPTPAVEHELAPGVTGAGVVDPFALGEAHRSALRARSFRLERTLNVTRPNGTVLRRTERLATVAPNASRIHVVDTAVDTDGYPVRAVAPRIEVWWAGGPALFRLSGDGEVEYRRADDVALSGPTGDLTLADRITGLLAVTDTEVVGREPDDPVRVRLVADGVGSESVLRVPPFLERPRNVSVAIVVDTRGVVHEYRIDYDATFDGEPVHVVKRATFTVLVRPVLPPVWVSEAEGGTGVTAPAPATSSL